MPPSTPNHQPISPPPLIYQQPMFEGSSVQQQQQQQQQQHGGIITPQRPPYSVSVHTKPLSHTFDSLPASLSLISALSSSCKALSHIACLSSTSHPQCPRLLPITNPMLLLLSIISSRYLEGAASSSSSNNNNRSSMEALLPPSCLRIR